MLPGELEEIRAYRAGDSPMHCSTTPLLLGRLLCSLHGVGRGPAKTAACTATEEKEIRVGGHLDGALLARDLEQEPRAQGHEERRRDDEGHGGRGTHGPGLSSEVGQREGGGES